LHLRAMKYKSTKEALTVPLLGIEVVWTPMNELPGTHKGICNRS
jgi:hypothetical protein